MKSLALEKPYSPQSQARIIVASALYHIRGGRERREVLHLIKDLRWFAFHPSDKIPYKSAQEERWQTMLSFARDSLKTDGLMERSVWQLTSDGINQFVLLKRAAKSSFDLGECYLFGAALKVYINPDYHPSGLDKERPALDIYEDQQPIWRKSVRGTAQDRKLEDVLKQYGDILPSGKFVKRTSADAEGTSVS